MICPNMQAEDIEQTKYKFLYAIDISKYYSNKIMKNYTRALAL
jgi:hypothetical protein